MHKEQLIARIHTVIAETTAYLQEHEISLNALVQATGFAKLAYLQDAANAMCESIETRKAFMTYAGELCRLMKYTDRDDVNDAVRADKDAIVAIYDELQKKRKHSNNTDLMVQIHKIVNTYIQVERKCCQLSR